MRVFLPLAICIDGESRHITCSAGHLESSTRASRRTNRLCAGRPCCRLWHFPVLELASTDSIMQHVFYSAPPTATCRPSKSSTGRPQTSTLHHVLDVTSTANTPLGDAYLIPPISIAGRGDEVAAHRARHCADSWVAVRDSRTGVREVLTRRGLPVANVAGVGLQGAVQGDFRLLRVIQTRLNRAVARWPAAERRSTIGISPLKVGHALRLDNSLPGELQPSLDGPAANPLQIRLDSTQSPREIVQRGPIALQISHQIFTVINLRGDRNRRAERRLALQVAGNDLARADQVILGAVDIRLDIADRLRRRRDIGRRRIQMSIN